MQASPENKSTESSQHKIRYLLKTRGPLTAASMAEKLELTSMGARQHLLKLTKTGDITSYLKAEGRGRPKRFWMLTQRGQSYFPDRHEDLTLELIDSIEQVFGEQGLEKLIAVRETETLNKYQARLVSCCNLSEKVETLAKIRSEEGYMASIEKEGEGYLLIENHCPICAAASRCQGFCRSELEIFQSLLQGLAEVKRLEHQIAGARRCAYRITGINLN
ncbi:MAG TPA: transcriptional regulator [Aeromonadales bacterium]|nr:transcriptional regulator [Aeromonadales bacterium]